MPNPERSWMDMHRFVKWRKYATMSKEDPEFTIATWDFIVKNSRPEDIRNRECLDRYGQPIRYELEVLVTVKVDRVIEPQPNFSLQFQ